MLLSMTGYGRVTQTFEEKNIVVEIRSLNSKYTDIRLRIPQNYKEKETELRKILSERLKRGKIEMLLEVNSLEGDDEYGLNLALFKKYYKELTSLRRELGFENGDLMASILRLPNVVATAESEINEEEWNAVLAALEEALAKFNAFRTTEGLAMENDLSQRASNIIKLLEKIDPHEQERIVNLKQRLKQRLNEFLGKDQVDENRFEQEIIFYLEKIDVTEEKVRLAQHCKYFLDELKKNVNPKGRKLSFISQEIGREINTLGAKAYSSDIQRIVVEMKDELEKIKEQVANSV